MIGGGNSPTSHINLNTKTMTIEQMSRLGDTGTKIMNNLKEIKEAVSEIDKVKFKSTVYNNKEVTMYEDKEDLIDYIDDTIKYILDHMSNLQEAQQPDYHWIAK